MLEFTAMLVKITSNILKASFMFGLTIVVLSLALYICYSIYQDAKNMSRK